MVATSRKQGLTLVEVLVVIGVVAFLIMLLLPAINADRSVARKSTCMSNMKQIGIALAAYHEAHQKLPPGCEAGSQDKNTGKISWDKDWSFLVYLLPHLDAAAMYNSLDIERKGPLQNPDANSEGKSTQAHAIARNTLFMAMICSSTTATGYRDLANHTDALTSYKAISGTHRQSLRFVSPEDTSSTMPLYPPGATVAEYMTMHPDGTMYPGSEIRMEDITDGASYTAVVTETVEPHFARWVYGPECMVYMLNPTPSITFDNTYSKVVDSSAGQHEYWHPAGFNGRFGDEALAYPNCRTTISCDYFVAPDQGQYLPGFEDHTSSTDDAKLLGRLCGPGSGHPTVVNFLMGDGSVKSISPKMDPAAIMFITTRAGHDPAPAPVIK
jgi:competence protein ComGC